MSLPVKRIYDHKTNRLKEATKLPREFELFDNEILLKVKYIGVNYQKDFQLIKNCGRDIVPCNKFIGKVDGSNDTYHAKYFDALANEKYMVFPYTNCFQQNITPMCDNCSQSIKGANLPCLGNLEYGLNINGGFQDYVKVPNFHEIAIKISRNISCHDALFLLDIALPFYTCLKTHFGDKMSHFNTNSKKLVILSDCKSELNDILLVMKLLELDESNLHILDVKSIEQMSESDQRSYHFKYDQLFVFNFAPHILEFAMKCSMSRGLQSCKSRYHAYLFNQYSPSSLSALQSLYEDDLNDKTLIHFKLNWFNRCEFIELLEYVSYLNESSHSPTSSVRSTSTTTVSSDWTDYPSPPLSEYRKGKTKNHWIWYEKDYDETDIKQVNKSIQTARVSRICYNNKPVKSNLNALVLDT